MLKYTSLAQLAEEAQSAGVSIGEIVLRDQSLQMERTEDALLQEMDAQLSIMEQAAETGAAPDIRSASGLTGGNGYKMNQYACTGGVSGAFAAQAIATAISVAECNAAMGKIVASPTAGSCGILPGAAITMMRQRGVSRAQAVLALMAAGGVGMVIANQASISGAEGGCQAECGSASAMAAAAIVQMAGGTPDMAIHAAAIAIKNQLGLVCDPVAGLVEVPCVKRNAGGVMNAICAAEMALAGIQSVIPPDEVIAAMREVGCALPSDLRETAKGGLAATPTAQDLTQRIFKANG